MAKNGYYVVLWLNGAWRAVSAMLKKSVENRRQKNVFLLIKAHELSSAVVALQSSAKCAGLGTDECSREQKVATTESAEK